MKIFAALLLCFSLSQVQASTVIVGSVNYAIDGGKDLPTLLTKVDGWMSEAKRRKVSYLLLPELITFDLLPIVPTDKDLPKHLKQIADQSDNFLKGLIELAVRHEMSIIGASTLVTSGPGKFINRAYFIGSDGKVQIQDKNYPTPWERKYNVQGVEGIKLFKTPDFSFVILICYDSEFPSISGKLSTLSPEVLFVPSQTDDTHGLERVKRTSAARAIEHMAYVIMTGTAGDTSAAWHSYVGKNHLFAPQNRIIDESDKVGKANAELTVFPLDLEKLRRSRADPGQIWPGRDEKKIK